jgi:glycosyltransferase involved in cell wall biosynthesis
VQPIHNPDVTDGAPLPSREAMPDRLLYSIAADIGGSGLPLTAEQGLLASSRGDFLGRAIGYRNHQRSIPPGKIRSLAWHPVKLLSNLDRETYYGAKKQYLDWITARELRRGSYDCFHGWSGDCLRSLIVARQKGVPTMIEIPTWHRNKFRPHKFYTKSERERPDTWRNRLRVNRQQILTEYELADLILVQSETAAASFLDKGFDRGRIFLVARGADPEAFRPARYPDIFRLTFVGALKKRKGVHHLLEAWHRLGLNDAELVLVGTVHDEIKPWLEEHKTDSVILPGFVRDVRPYLERSSAFVFTSECEGSAKATYEAAASALPQITTRESGDVVVDGLNGIVIPANDPAALAEAIRECHRDRDALAAMGSAARQRFEERFTWEHHRRRLLHAYATLAAGVSRR